jgi:hypothetical protein
MAIELVPLATATATLSAPIILPNTPAGTRLIFEVSDYRFEGERFVARQRGVAAADWLVVGPEGTGTLDVRVTLETRDGAVVLLQYGGRVNASGGFGGAPIYAAPRFDTGDDRYAWLNRIQAVAKGRLQGNLLEYEVYELR